MPENHCRPFAECIVRTRQHLVKIIIFVNINDGWHVKAAHSIDINIYIYIYIRYVYVYIYRYIDMCVYICIYIYSFSF